MRAGAPAFCYGFVLLPEGPFAACGNFRIHARRSTEVGKMTAKACPSERGSTDRVAAKAEACLRPAESAPRGPFAFPGVAGIAGAGDLAELLGGNYVVGAANGR